MNDRGKWVWVVVGLLLLVLASRALSVPCAHCGLLSSQWPAFVTGTAMIGALVGGLLWLESAPLGEVAKHGVVALPVLGVMFSLL